MRILVEEDNLNKLYDNKEEKLFENKNYKLMVFIKK